MPGSVNARVEDAKTTAQSALDGVVSTLNQALADQEELLTGQLVPICSGRRYHAGRSVGIHIHVSARELVQDTGRLYRALQDVPAGTLITDTRCCR